MGDVVLFPDRHIRRVLGAEAATVIPRPGNGTGVIWFSGVPSEEQLRMLVERLVYEGRSVLFKKPMRLILIADDAGSSWTVLTWEGYPLTGKYLHNALVQFLPLGSALPVIPITSWQAVRGTLLREVHVA